MRVIIPIVSLCLYCMAPISYSYEFTLICVFLFLINSFQLLKKDFKKIGFINFNIIFLISFFLCSYAFPVFLLPIGETGYLYTSSAIGLEETTVNKTTALNTFIISIYTLSYLSYRGRRTKQLVECSARLAIILKVAVIYASILLIVSVCFFHANNPDSVAVTTNPFLGVLYTSIYTIFLTVIFSDAQKKRIPLKKIINHNAIVFILLSIVLLLFFVIGDRGPILTIGLISVAAYYFCYEKIKLKYLAIFISCGFGLLLLIGLTRGGDISFSSAGITGAISGAIDKSSSRSLWFLLEDLTGRYIEINCGYKYFQDHGPLYPWKIIPILFAPFPFIPTFLSRLIYGLPFMELSSSNIINQALFSNMDAWMGSHCVIDAYMSWGIIGCTIIYLMMGYFFSYLASNYKKNILFTAMYISLVSVSMYLPRAIFFEFYRPITWTFILCIIFIRHSNSKLYRGHYVCQENQ